MEKMVELAAVIAIIIVINPSNLEFGTFLLSPRLAGPAVDGQTQNILLLASGQRKLNLNPLLALLRCCFILVRLPLFQIYICPLYLVSSPVLPTTRGHPIAPILLAHNLSALVLFAAAAAAGLSSPHRQNSPIQAERTRTRQHTLVL